MSFEQKKYSSSEENLQKSVEYIKTKKVLDVLDSLEKMKK